MLELLAPAGNMEKLKTAFLYGADACYFAGKKYGLRAFSGNFEDDELKQSIEFAHSLNKKAYITVNIIAHNKDFNGMKEYLQYLEKINADAIIVADVGIITIAKQYAPKLKIHVSTQANITNKYSAKFFADLGVDRLILARELSVNEIKEIRDFIPKEIEIEVFVHGAMCISYSGRCLLSNYFTGRDSNCGACVQACRWEYVISEKSRKNEFYEIQEDERGTYILNSKDLCMIEYLDKLKEIGVTSFKIEGRMKSPYYVATVVNAYRRAIDILENSSKEYKCPQELVEELNKASHRRYTTGFYFGSDDKEYTKSSMPVQSCEFIAIVLEDSNNGYALVEMRNRFEVGDNLEILSPKENFNKSIEISEILDEDNNKIKIANLVQQKLKIKTDLKLYKGDILRRKLNNENE